MSTRRAPTWRGSRVMNRTRTESWTAAARLSLHQSLIHPGAWARTAADGVYDRRGYREESANAPRRLAVPAEMILNPPDESVAAIGETAE